ncbi:hypothetical protein A2T98_13155 [Nodularia spumigena CENA596]|uniref:Uncharacterized protein n=1 Tax=Nodularia spumigena CENA596 TaxID=1819295 RepID=A0A166J8H1_NODSP|nr:hypothetical protein [Nodularia spumigena]KZL49361.1 hypothetical protein A2T98_13155 [Nodularia spumigena CENA596]
MSELNQSEKLTGSIVIGVIFITIIVPTLWNNYKEHQERERRGNACEQLTAIRANIIRRYKEGDPTVTSLELGAAYQLGAFTGDCKVP